MNNNIGLDRLTSNRWLRRRCGYLIIPPGLSPTGKRKNLFFDPDKNSKTIVNYKRKSDKTFFINVDCIGKLAILVIENYPPSWRTSTGKFLIITSHKLVTYCFQKTPKKMVKCWGDFGVISWCQKHWKLNTK